MRNWEKETQKRVEFIKEMIKNSNAKGVVYGNSGGKDCTLVGILARKATSNVLSVMMPCSSSRNYGADMEHAVMVCKQYDIPNITVDLTKVKEQILIEISASSKLNSAALSNIAPRLRMTTLYAIAQSNDYLVAGTGNASEKYMGYFTKWGDGAYDFNPIADLTVTEIYDFLRYLGAPNEIIEKAPSAGLYEGQTDELEMGVAYADIDRYILTGKTDEKAEQVIKRFHERSHHKRSLPVCYSDK